MKDIAVVGHSGFAKEIRWLIDRVNHIKPAWNFIGFIDDNQVSDEVIGDDDFIRSYKKELAVVIAIGNPWIRKKVYEKYRENKLLVFPNLIDPSAIISEDLSMGMGNIVCAGTVITVDVHIGDFNILNLDCTVGHEISISDFVTVNPSVNVSGNVKICAMSNIGAGAQILQGVGIGVNAVIGAGAVVTRDIAGNCTAGGVPAKIIKGKG